MRQLSCLTTSCFSTNQSYCIFFDCLYYLCFVLMNGQFIGTVDLCLLGYHYITKHNRLEKDHLWDFLPRTSKPLIKILLFLDSVKIYFRLLLAITCFLKFCIIFAPLYFLSLSPLIIDSRSLLRLNWLTFILKFIDLSNS